MVRPTRLIQCASTHGSLFRDLTGGFPSGPAAVKMPHKQAGHMKATDQTHPRQNALAKGASTYESQFLLKGNPTIQLGRIKL
jgi:hypothetical protein